jgi:hypothetical protein
MDSTITIAIIGASATIFGAALTYYLTKKQQIDKEWRESKINHYKVLISSLSDLAVDGTDKNEANMRFALAVNTISLVAPQYVVTALMNFHDEVKFSNPNKKPENHDKLLIELLLAIRKDIGISKKDDSKTFKFHLIGSSPK